MAVVVAAGGYPGAYEKGLKITGIEAVDDTLTKVFHAGTTERDGDIVTSGGRVLCVTALGDDIAQAQQKAYRGVDQIHWQGAFSRRDIGWRAIARDSQRNTLQ
jgi:phosphoribosylamine--glycine ligase